MAGTLKFRSEDTVREDFRHYINTFINKADDREEEVTTEEYALLQSIAIKLQEPDNMLTKAEAIYAKNILTQYAIRDIEILNHKRSNGLYVDVLNEVDCMSLYADIVCMYLRPGTYTLN